MKLLWGLQGIWMSVIRSALAFTAAERLIVLSINFVTLAIVARLLSPEEIGFSAIGAAALAVAESFRDFGATGFIVQQVHLTREEARTASTIMLLLSVAVTIGLWSASGALADFYHKPHLQTYLQVAALTFLPGPVSGPLMALLRRNMQFRALAVINVISSSATAFSILALALLGASFMSFAWGNALGATTAALMALLFCRQHWVLRPSLSAWRTTLTFGLFTSGAGLIWRATESLPSLILGRILTFNDVAFYTRAVTVCALPDKCLLTGLLPVALPAMAAEVRANRSLTPIYLRGFSLITAVQWPAFIMLALLARPAVAVLLGSQWTSIVPLVRIMALAALASSPCVLFYPTIIALGSFRAALWCALVMLPVSASVTAVASSFGIMGVAYSTFVIVSVQSAVSVYFVRRSLGFGFRDLTVAMSKSLIVTACSVIAPIVTLAATGAHDDVSIGIYAIVAVEAAVGWMLGLGATRHPLLLEMIHVFEQAWLPLRRRLRRAQRNRWVVP